MDDHRHQHGPSGHAVAKECAHLHARAYKHILFLILYVPKNPNPFLLFLIEGSNPIQKGDSCCIPFLRMYLLPGSFGILKFDQPPPKDSKNNLSLSSSQSYPEVLPYQSKFKDHQPTLNKAANSRKKAASFPISSPNRWNISRATTFSINR